MNMVTNLGNLKKMFRSSGPDERRAVLQELGCIELVFYRNVFPSLRSGVLGILFISFRI